MAMMSSSIVSCQSRACKVVAEGADSHTVPMHYPATLNPHGQVPQGAEVEQVQVASVQSEDLTLSEMLQLNPVPNPFQLDVGLWC